MSEKFYQFNINQLNGEEISLSEFKGKVVLIVNTASNCGLTYHYTGLEKLYQEYKDNGLVILGFPCNQFGKQEPGTSEEIQDFCSTNYNVTFPLNSIKWNFTKFLIDRNGVPFKRFSSTVEPKDITPFIDQLL
jgi:glutathione peroxidase